jgi:RNA polymerase sigma factor for flagellar operon FliA
MADSLGSIAGLSDEEVVERYTDFMKCVIFDTLRICGVGTGRFWEDAWADANLGLMRARAVFEEGRGAKFSTYAYYRIKGEIVDGLRRMGHIRRSSRAEVDVLSAATSVGESRAEDGLSARPDFSEAMSALDRSIQCTAIAWLIVQTQQVVEEERRDVNQPQKTFEKEETAARLRQVVEDLPTMDRRIIQGLYFKRETLQILSDELGYSRSWVCRVHINVLGRIAALMEAG